MILILEDDADREAYQTRSPVNPEFYIPGMRLPTVWISPEAYRAEAVLADLRAKVEEALVEYGCPEWEVEPGDGLGAHVRKDQVLALLGGIGDD